MVNHEHSTTAQTRRRRWRIGSLLAIAGPTLIVILLSLGAAPWLIQPSYPRTLVIATGSPEGAYYAYAERYRELLAKDNITLEIRTTAGSVENLELLRDPNSGVSLAFVQGGVATNQPSSGLQSLGSLYLEPIWVFYRAPEPISLMSDLRSRRIAIGPEGSGTRMVASELLAASEGVTVAELSTFALSDLSGSHAAEALKKGDIDAAVFVISPTSPMIRDLLETEGIRLMSFRRAKAFQQRFPYLASVTLSEGILDLNADLPAEDITLLAPTANLVAVADLHPVLVPLLLEVASKVHEPGSFLEKPGEFPSDRYIDVPMKAQTQRWLKSGPSLLYRYLPFQIAALIDRLKLLLLPLFTLLFPLFKVAPPVYRWRIRYKIYRWYRVLREVDLKLKESSPDTNFGPDLERLRAVEDELADVAVPLSYMQEFYNLRLHVAYVLARLSQRAASTETPAVTDLAD